MWTEVSALVFCIGRYSDPFIGIRVGRRKKVVLLQLF